MHGLINRSIQSFVSQTYGSSVWQEIAQDVDLPEHGFEAMLEYDDHITHRMLDAVALQLDKSRANVLEDVGTFLVSNPKTHAIRRLLRFGGETFVEFVSGLDDLPNRVGLAVPEMQFPQLETFEVRPGEVSVHLTGADPEFGFVLMGILRTMADDYGSLVFLEHESNDKNEAILTIKMLDTAFSEGNAFTLAEGITV
ncbi:MAG: heme NO-binding domain-containing protein [Pseudomonadota bacterium]